MAEGKRKSGNANIVVDLIVDTRETKPWLFDIKLPSGFEIGMAIEQKLDAGDYSILGYDTPNDVRSSICIERKQSLEELLGNLGKYWERFERELARLSKYTFAVIIVEDDLHNAYARFKSSPYFNYPPSFILKRIAEVQMRYGIGIHFLTNRSMAQSLAANLMKSFILENARF